MSGRSTDTGSAYNGVAVTPTNGAKIPVTRALYIGGAGDVAVVFAGGGSTPVTLAGAAAGTKLMVQVNEVRSTNTTATNIVALY